MKSAEKIKQIFLNIIDWFLVEPKRLVRLIVLSICSIVVFFQLWECAMKLLHPPISTHSHFDLNETMFYPAVTFCREPAFKVEVMSVGNLFNNSSHDKHICFTEIQLVEASIVESILEKFLLRQLFALECV